MEVIAEGEVDTGTFNVIFLEQFVEKMQALVVKQWAEGWMDQAMKHFDKLLRKHIHVLEGDYALRREHEVTRTILDRQVSQTNSIFIIVDKCERNCRDIEKQFYDLKETFNTKADVQALIDVEWDLK